MKKSVEDQRLDIRLAQNLKMDEILRQQAARPIGIKPGRHPGRYALAKESGE